MAQILAKAQLVELPGVIDLSIWELPIQKDTAKGILHGLYAESYSEDGIPNELHYYENDTLVALRINQIEEDTAGKPLPYFIRQHNYMITFLGNGMVYRLKETFDSLYSISLWADNPQHSYHIKNILIYNDIKGMPLYPGTLKDGTGTVWKYGDGSVRSIINYVDGYKKGPWINYNENGQLSTIFIYSKNRRIRTYTYDSIGTKVIKVEDHKN